MIEIEYKAWELANPNWIPDCKLQSVLEARYQSILFKHL